MSVINPKIIYMGTPDFAVPALMALAEKNVDILYVVTQPDRPRGRGHKLSPSAVKEAAVKLDIPVLQPEIIKNNDEFYSLLEDAAPNLIVVAAYGKILPKRILDLPSEGCINIHASLLPKFRGAAPIHRAIEAGEVESGVSLMYISEKLDEGDVFATSSVDIRGLNSGELHDILANEGAKLLASRLDDIIQGKVTRTTQDDSKATYASMLSKEDGKIDFSESTKGIANKILAMTPFPGAYAFLKEGSEEIKYKIKRAHELSGDDKENRKLDTKRMREGTILGLDEKRIIVVTGDGFIELDEIQIPGGKPMLVQEYLKGHSIQENAVFR